MKNFYHSLLITVEEEEEEDFKTPLKEDDKVSKGETEDEDKIELLSQLANISMVNQSSHSNKTISGDNPQHS